MNEIQSWEWAQFICTLPCMIGGFVVVITVLLSATTRLSAGKNTDEPDTYPVWHQSINQPSMPVCTPDRSCMITGAKNNSRSESAAIPHVPAYSGSEEAPIRVDNWPVKKTR